MATQPEVKADAGYGPEPQLTVAQPALRADPGGSAQTQVVVRHGGNRVEGFALDVVGLPPDWWRVEPPLLELLPGTSGTAVVEFRPPAGTPAPDAPLPFGVRATSALDTMRAVVEEGDLEVGRQLSLTAEIAPLTSRGRWRGRHVVTFTNWGNAPIDLELSGRDRDGRLAFLFAPAGLKVPIGGTANSRLKARIRRPVLRGKREQIPFQVVAAGPGGLPVPGTPGAAGSPAPGVPGVPGMPASPADAGRRTLDAVVEQRSVLSNGVLVALALVALLVVALVAWLIRAPAVRGAQRDADVPPAPQVVRLNGFTKDGKASLKWAQDDSAHKVGLVVNGDGEPARRGTPQKWTAVAPYASGTTVEIEDFSPKTTYCFAVVAVQGSRESAPVMSNCRQPSSRVDAPTDLTLTLLANKTRALLAWKGDKTLDHLVVRTDAQGAVLAGAEAFTETVPKGATRTTVPATGELICFTVQAGKGSAAGAISEPGCTSGPGAPASPSPSSSSIDPPPVSPPSSQPPSQPPSSPESPSPSTLDRLRGRYLVAIVVNPVTQAGFDINITRENMRKAYANLKTAGYRGGAEDAWWIELPPFEAQKRPATFVAYADVVASEDEAAQACAAFRERAKRPGSPLAGYSCSSTFSVPKASS